MTTYGEGSNNTTFVIAMMVGLALIIGAVFAAQQSGNLVQKQHDAAPCSSFKQEKLSDLPARCITPQGGFNE